MIETADRSVVGQLLHDEVRLLPDAVASFHASTCGVGASGHLDVHQSTTRRGRLVATLLRLPRTSGSTPVTVTIARTLDRSTGEMVEHWTRRFDGQAMDSIQTACGDHLVERLGRVELRFVISVVAGRLCFDHVATTIRVGRRGLPLPRRIAPHITASVGGGDDRDGGGGDDGGNIDVSVRVDAPLLGRLFSYSGRLTPKVDR